MFKNIKIPMQVKYLIVILLISLSFVSTLKADYLKVGSNYCVLDFWYEDTLLYYHKSKYPDVIEMRNLRGETFLGGYVYDADNDTCLKDNTFSSLGLTDEDYQFSMALTGLISGVLIASTVILILKV